MARVTVEDCIRKVPSRFELVVLASRRARQIAAGAPIAVERDNDKNPVVALREIADEAVNVDDIREALIASYRQYAQAEPHEEELEDLLERELASALLLSEGREDFSNDIEKEDFAALQDDLEADLQAGLEDSSQMYQDADIIEDK